MIFGKGRMRERERIDRLVVRKKEKGRIFGEVGKLKTLELK